MTDVLSDGTLPEDVEEIRVRLPLSLDTSARLMQAIGSQWPDARVSTQPSTDMVFVVDRSPLPEELAGLEAELDASIEMTTDGGFAMDTPPNFALSLVALFREILDSHEAENYVEMQIHDPGTRDLYTVTIGRPGGLTPAQKLTRAESEIALLRSRLAAAENC